MQTERKKFLDTPNPLLQLQDTRGIPSPIKGIWGFIYIQISEEDRNYF
jgi:hypothetical protein